MSAVIKLIIFLVFFFSMGIGFYKTFIFLNGKIKGSQTAWQLLGYSVLLIAVNLLIYFGGLYLLIVIYQFLSS